MVPPASDRIPRVPSYSGSLLIHSQLPTGLSPAVEGLSIPLQFLACMLNAVLQPRLRGLGSTPFARHYSGYHVCFLFLWLLRCFSSPGWLLLAYVFSQKISRSPWKGCPIRSPGSQWICAPRTGFSQLVASFFADRCLGIPRVHSIA